MLVANSFDLWQKDAFFSAAEEVQQSADIMESAYRKWLRAREGLVPQHLDEISRELQTALGTAKWQLEEFERAVCQSYRNNGDDITITRHRQFVSAIEDQISCVETTLKEALKVDGKKPFRWVNLDEEECDDLAHFLSGASKIVKDEKIPIIASSLSQSNIKEDCGFVSDVSSRTQMSHPLLEIVIDSDDRQMNASIEVTPKEKGSKPFFWRLRGGNYHGVQRNTQMKMINWINHRLRGGHASQRQHVSLVLPVKSIRFVLAFMLTVFLVVPFLIHSRHVHVLSL